MQLENEAEIEQEVQAKSKQMIDKLERFRMTSVDSAQFFRVTDEAREKAKLEI